MKNNSVYNIIFIGYLTYTHTCNIVHKMEYLTCNINGGVCHLVFLEPLTYRYTCTCHIVHKMEFCTKSFYM